MAHRHDHEDHHHHHHHHHHHKHDKESEMSFPEKMEKLMNHWIKHNKDHAETYRKWADKAIDEGMADIARLIEDAAAVSEKVDVALENALERLKNRE